MPKRTHHLDRLPPHSQEAEQGVLGCLLLDPRENLPLCITELPGGAEAFYDLRHRTIYETALEMSEDGKPVDIISLQQALRDAKQLDAVGGLPYVSSLPDAVPCATHISYYLGILKQKASLRRLISTCTDYVSKAFDNEASAHKLVEDFERDALKVRVESGKSGKEFGALLNRAAMKLEEASSKSGILGLPTGYIDLDDATDGLQGGEMIVIAARPSMGKAQPFDSMVLTPSGFVTMAEIYAGRIVIGGDGLPHRVLQVFPQGLMPIYEVKFSDGTSTKCTANHLWFTQERLERRRGCNGSVKTTRQIMDSLTIENGSRKNHRVPPSRV